MVDQLREVIASIEQLPPDQQAQLAEHLKVWISDQQWDVWLKSSEGERFLDDLVAGYYQEQQEGTLQEEDW